MKSTTYVLSGAIAAPADAVFALLTDPARLPEWYPGCSEVKTKGSSLKKGERFTLRFQTRTRIRERELQVIEYAAPSTFGWTELGPRGGSKTFFKLQFGGGSTAVTMKHIWAPHGLFAWLRGALVRKAQIQRQFDGALQNIRKILTQ